MGMVSYPLFGNPLTPCTLFFPETLQIFWPETLDFTQIYFQNVHGITDRKFSLYYKDFTADLTTLNGGSYPQVSLEFFLA
jgi:hypothetical protein